jgi:hypothetical protein
MSCQWVTTDSKKRVTFEDVCETKGERVERMAKRAKVESMNPVTARALLLGDAFMGIMDVFCSKGNDVRFFGYLDTVAIGQTNSTIRNALKGAMERREKRLADCVTVHFNRACIDIMHWSAPWHSDEDVMISIDHATPAIEEMHKHTLSLHHLMGCVTQVDSLESFIRRLLKFNVSKSKIKQAIRCDEHGWSDDGWQLLHDNKERLITHYWRARSADRPTFDLTLEDA